ncbi:hypothetical protein JZO66_08760 [Enterococcus sp. DIV0242_7C1]|uniref:Alternate signal-mediated exported protein n=1 Tax=Candidatus Enterococcus dunnyi TaxID=1834192 RepID=A0A200J782_9ENTE|nr:MULTISPECIES: hypothetical protein [unclassified Enterococcus]MBO0470635.1 hypothetical protein [Enterococcus sp. DIV0242_7C1]OUZ33083.1 hypothetical protein A5889_001792 [Enterococcus sp. 9D6_DIV0238]
MKEQKQTIYFVWLLPFFVLCLIMGGITVYAAMTMQEEKVNRFQIGNLQTKIDEVFTEPTTILPNKALEKKVDITNTGTLDQFVRVLLQPEISIEKEGVRRLLPSKIGDEVLLDVNTSQWRLGEDGYYYYMDILKPGVSHAAKNLFTQVTLKRSIGAEYHGAKVSLLVKVEAIDCNKYSYRDAWWQGAVPVQKELLDIDKQLAIKAE